MGVFLGGWVLYMLGYCHSPENFNTRPSPVENMHFEGHQNMNQMRSPLMEKEKFVHSFFKRS